MLKDNILELYKKAVLYVNLAVLNDKLISLLKTNESFSNLITNLLTIIELIENDNEIVLEEKNSESLKIAFNTITGTEFKLNEKISLNDIDECNEIINYFPKFILNTLKISIEDLEAETKKSNTSNQEAKFVESEVIDNNKSNESFENNSKKSFDSEKFMNNSGFNMEYLADDLVNQYALNILNTKIRSGQVYVFDTKPKIIPILKYICIFLFAVFLILSITTFSLLASINNKIIWYPSHINGITNSNSQQFGYQTITFPFQLILSIMIVIMIIMSLIKNNKNDNLKYRFAWGWIAFYVAISLFSALMELNTEFLIDYKFASFKQMVNQTIQNANPSNCSDLIKNNENYFKVINYYRYVQFSIYGVLCAIIIVLAVSAIFNPKRDVNRINKLIDQYADDIKSGSIDITSQDNNSGFMSRFGNGFF